MINNSNFDIYNDPANYDLESGRYDPDGSILLELTAQANGRILELGCGTGRITIPLAKRGIELTALDLLPHLLEYAKSKADGLPIEWHCQDVRTFDLDRQFSFIFTKGSVFNHLLNRTDQEAMLSRVHHHLAPGGKFLFDIGFKRPDKMVDVTEPEAWFTFTDKDGREVTMYGTDHYDHLDQIWTQTSTYRWQENGRIKESAPTKLILRYIMPQEMEALLHYNGFKILARYGDFKGKPLNPASYEQIYLCTH